MDDDKDVIFTTATDPDTLGPDAFTSRYRLPQPQTVQRGKRETIRLQTRRKQARFLVQFAQSGVEGTACEAVGISRNTVKLWRARDDQFATLYDAAAAEAGDRVEHEAIRRAVDGWDEPVYQGGKKVGVIHRYSDNLLACLIKARRPAFRENRLSQVTNVQNNVAVVPIERLTDEEFALMGKIMGKRELVVGANRKP